MSVKSVCKSHFKKKLLFYNLYILQIFSKVVFVPLKLWSCIKVLNVDFNSLDINFNLQTWVVILDFFGIGSGGDESATEAAPQAPGATPLAAGGGRTEIEVLVRCLGVRFNDQRRDLFQVEVREYEV